jgi:hypothetical protein
MTERTNVWKLTTIGLLAVGASALVTGLVVANRVGSRTAEAPVASLNAPAASPVTVQTPPAAVVQAPPPAVVQAPPPTVTEPSRPASPPPASQPARVAQTPSQSAIDACNREAANATGGSQRDKKGKITEVVKDGAIGAIGGAAIGAVGGAIADGGKGAGKGAIIGGLAGAGGGSLYGIYDNKKHDERYRTAYSSCMRSRGYTS